MADAEADQRRQRQRRALQVQAGGARIETHYQHRTTKVVGVNETDLRDLLTIDGVELGLISFGQFMFSGALWLLLDKMSEEAFAWGALTGFCAASILFGLALIVAGWSMRHMKRRKINSIFNETGTP